MEACWGGAPCAPSEYFAFFGLEITMYCCSGGRVAPLPGAPPCCLGDWWAGAGAWGRRGGAWGRGAASGR